MAPRKTARKTAAKAAPATEKVAKAAPKKESPEMEARRLIEAGISRFVEELGLDNQKARYKAQRAIAFQAFLEALDENEFEALVDRAIENAEDLPHGWSVEAKPRPAKVEEEIKEDVEDEEEVEEDDTDADSDADSEDDTEDDIEEEEIEEPVQEELDVAPAPKKPVRRRRPAAKK